MVCLQDFTPVRESVIWPLLHRFYMEMGLTCPPLVPRS